MSKVLKIKNREKMTVYKWPRYLGSYVYFFTYAFIKRSSNHYCLCNTLIDRRLILSSGKISTLFIRKMKTSFDWIPNKYSGTRSLPEGLSYNYNLHTEFLRLNVWQLWFLCFKTWRHVIEIFGQWTILVRLICCAYSTNNFRPIAWIFVKTLVISSYV